MELVEVILKKKKTSYGKEYQPGETIKVRPELISKLIEQGVIEDTNNVDEDSISDNDEDQE